MKTRNGFVSNSSSSSFLITPENIEELKEIKRVIDWFIDEEVYTNGDFEYEIDTECATKDEYRLYELLSSIGVEHYRNS